MSSDAEQLKHNSHYLRGPLAAELANDESGFSDDANNLLKFHGIYQQDDRDRRRELTRAGEGPAYSCMVRCAVPAGVLRSDQWFEIDRLADTVAPEGTPGALRLTTRQGVQYHFVHKGGLKGLVNALNHGLVTTYAACGDVVRNIMVSSAPHAGRDLERVESLARALANRFRPRSAAYWELWLDGERAVSSGPAAAGDRPSSGDDAEPIYGPTYLPRKFKIGIAVPGDNSIDVYSNCVGIVPIDGPDGEPGAVVLAGGGLGRNHADETTFPRLAEPMAWVPEDRIVDVVEGIVVTFRDWGNREDRRKARLKYVVEEHGIDWLRHQVEEYLGTTLADPVPLPPWENPRKHLGWHRQDDSTWFIGVPVPGGRLVDTDLHRPRAAIRAVLTDHADEIRLTPNQDVLLCGIAEADKAAVEQLLTDHGVRQAERFPLSVLSSMACPALPTCGKALGEAERVLPEVTATLDRLLAERGLHDVAIETRMTGCPNGCARPYVAELGIVGRTKSAYDIFIGGDPAGTRLATRLIESVPLDKLADVVGPLLDRYRVDRLLGEGFGDWADRRGVVSLAEHLPVVSPRSRRAGRVEVERERFVGVGR
ncbi:MAG: NADPH-dependent assimilatory sulfite reductase hemoprotein subunit [Actinomycetota bacterium]